MRSFIPYVQMHEFEALLFSHPQDFALGIHQEALAPELQAICDAFGSPEEINDHPNTAPSKRIEGLLPRYQKPTDGVLAAKRIGLKAMRQECALFDRWITQLEDLSA
jgi:hypothetical protein